MLRFGDSFSKNLTKPCRKIQNKYFKKEDRKKRKKQMMMTMKKMRMRMRGERLRGG